MTEIFEPRFKPEPKTKAVVTFMIGNGFDLALGLHTSYADFLPVYLESGSDSPIIKNLKSEISRDAKLWGDAELAFGKLPFSKFGDNPHVVVKECIADFSNALADYLTNEEMRLQPPDEKLKSTFCCKLFSYYLALGEYARIHELERLKRFNTLKVNIINFNYTQTVDKLLIQSGVVRLPEWGDVKIEVNTPCHVHGALNVGYSRLFGVNDIAQVEDSHLDDQTKKLLVKPTIDRWAGCQLENTAKKMIDESDSVIVFGMSFGATDKIWWDYLLNRMRNDSSNHLCLVPYVDCDHGASSLSEEAEWAGITRAFFYDAVQAKNSYLTTEEFDRHIDVFLRGPYLDPTDRQVYCDPFQLGWLGRQLASSSEEKNPLPSLSASSSSSCPR